MLYCDWAVRNLNWFSQKSISRRDVNESQTVRLWRDAISCLVSVERIRWTTKLHIRLRPSCVSMPPSDSIIDHSVNPAEGRTYNNGSPKVKNTLLSSHVLPTQCCWCVTLIREPKRRRWVWRRRRTQEVREVHDAMKAVKKSARQTAALIGPRETQLCSNCIANSTWCV